MHRHRILAQISLIFSILNLILAAPIVVLESHEVRHDALVVAEDVAAMLKKRHGLEASSDRSTSPRSPPDESASALEPDLGNPGSSHPSTSGQSEIRLPAWSQELEAEMQPPTPHPAELAYPESPRPGSESSETSETPLHPYHPTSSSESETEMPIPERLQQFVPGSPLAAPSLPAELTSPRSSTSGSSEIPYMAIPEWLRKFVPSRPPTPQTSLPPTTGRPNNAEFYKEVIEKLGIPAAVTAVFAGTLITIGILGSKHHNQQDS